MWESWVVIQCLNGVLLSLISAMSTLNPPQPKSQALGFYIDMPSTRKFFLILSIALPLLMGFGFCYVYLLNFWSAQTDNISQDFANVGSYKGSIDRRNVYRLDCLLNGLKGMCLVRSQLMDSLRALHASCMERTMSRNLVMITSSSVRQRRGTTWVWFWGWRVEGVLSCCWLDVDLLLIELLVVNFREFNSGMFLEQLSIFHCTASSRFHFQPIFQMTTVLSWPRRCDGVVHCWDGSGNPFNLHHLQ